MGTADELKVQSLSRAFGLLEYLATVRSAGVQDLAREFSLPPSTVHRLLGALQGAGVVAKDPVTNQYQTSIRLFEWGQSAVNRLGIRELAKPYLQAFAGEHGETAAIAVLDRSDVVYIDWIPSPHLNQIRLAIGTRVPAIRSSLGKCLIAWLPEAARTELLREMPMYSQPGSEEALSAAIRELEAVHKRGYAIDDQERTPGARTLGAPLRNASGAVVAAVGIGAPVSRMSDERMAQLGPRLLEIASNISSHLGYNGAGSAGV
jgi:DNA-binding IclR family transcriptional regulator